MRIPAGRICCKKASGFTFVIERKDRYVEFLAVLPNQRPTTIAGDAFTHAIHLCFSMHFGARRNYQLPVMKNVFRYQSNNRRLKR